MIVSSSAIAVDSRNDDRNIELSVQSEVIAITNTESAAKIAEENGFIRLKSGTITAIPAILLNGGALTNFDVIVFLTEVLKDVPNFHAAAVISEAVTKLIPGLSCDLASLMLIFQLSGQFNLTVCVSSY
ncbi:MAG: PAC2 family protein [Nitrososphaeraceae archaeon]